MDDYTEVNIAQEVQDAGIERDVEIELNECTIPELGSLAKHETLCDRGVAQAHEAGKHRVPIRVPGARAHREHRQSR